MTEKGTKRQLFDKISLGACYAIDADGIFVADLPPVFFCFFVSFFNSVFSWPWRVFHFFVDSGCSPWLGSNSVYDIQDFFLYMYFNFWLMTLFLTYFGIWEKFSSSFSV